MIYMIIAGYFEVYEEGTGTDVLSREYATHGRESSHELDSALPTALG